MGYIGIRQILDDLLADDMMAGLSLERAVNYAVEFMKVVGMPKVFEKKEVEVEIKEYRGFLPCDMYEVVQVKLPDGPALVEATGSFKNNHVLSYVIKGEVITVSFEEGKVLVAYNAFPLDDEGFPLLPDNGTFPRALELYIQKRYFTNLFNSNKIPVGVLQNVQQEYAFYVGQARTDLILPNLDRMENMKRMWTSLIQRNHKHSDGFSTLNAQEKLKF